jgi:hypothetical protein
MKEMTMSYGDYHYRMQIENFGEFVNTDREEYAVRLYVLKALREFHMRDSERDAEVSKMRIKLWEFARDNPDVVPELERRKIL